MTELEITKIIDTFNDLFLVNDETNEITIKKIVGNSSIMYKDDILFNEKILEKLKLIHNIEIINKNENGVLFSFHNCNIIMNLYNNYYKFEIQSYEYDSDTDE